MLNVSSNLMQETTKQLLATKSKFHKLSVIYTPLNGDNGRTTGKK